MSFIDRFLKITKGGLVITGNTLGLSKKENENASGKIGSIGAFISNDINLQVPTFPKGTTLNYKNNGSKAELNIPKNSKILYAEVIWTGIYKSNNIDIFKNIYDPVYFVTPKGKVKLNPDYRTKFNKIIELNNTTKIGVYVNSCEVTQLIKTYLSNMYGLESIPSIIDPLDNNTSKTNFAGWTLIVAFQNNDYTKKILNIKVGLETVFTNSNNIKIPFQSFDVPIDGANESKILLSSGEGDAEILGDSLYYENDNNSIKLYGPNNYENNFFSSQINNNDGLIDKSGTFGDRNHNPKDNINIIAGRQGYDVTSVNLNNKLNSNQINPCIKFTSSGDLYFPNTIGFESNIKCADLKITKNANKFNISKIGDEILYTIIIENLGDIIAENIILNDPISPNLYFAHNSITINGEKFLGKFPLQLNNISKNEKITITYKTNVKSIPKDNIIKNYAIIKYDYIDSNNLKINNEDISNEVWVNTNSEMLTITKEVDKKYAVIGDILKYKIIIKNICNIKLSNVIFTDNIPKQTNFVYGSLYINDINYKDYDPIKGINLGTINSKDIINITFNVSIKPN